MASITAMADQLENGAEAEVPERIAATAEAVRNALEKGGFAEVTVRSRTSGRHVTVKFSAKKKRDGGRGYVPRNTRAGRVSLADASTVFVDDPSLDWDEGRVGSLDVASGSWRDARGADPARVWAATKVLAWIRGAFDLGAQAEVFIATRCCDCGARLRHPESVAELIGPECSGRRRKGRQAAREGAPVRG